MYWVQIFIILKIYWLYCTKRLPVQNCVVKINIQLDQGYIKIYQQAFVKDPGYRTSTNDTGRVRLEHFSQSMLIAHFFRFVNNTLLFSERCACSSTMWYSYFYLTKSAVAHFSGCTFKLYEKSWIKTSCNLKNL